MNENLERKKYSLHVHFFVLENAFPQGVLEEHTQRLQQRTAALCIWISVTEAIHDK